MRKERAESLREGGAKETEEVFGENKESIVSSLREGQEIYRGKKKKTREEVISGVAGCSSRKKLERTKRASPGISLDFSFLVRFRYSTPLFSLLLFLVATYLIQMWIANHSHILV